MRGKKPETSQGGKNVAPRNLNPSKIFVGESFVKVIVYKDYVSVACAVIVMFGFAMSFVIRPANQK